MSHNPFEGSNNLFEGSHRSLEAARVQPVASEMRDIVLEAAWPPVPGESVGAVIQRAARKLRIGYSRVRAYYYHQVRLVTAEEADQLRAARREILAERLRRMDAEMAALRARLGDQP